MPLRRALDVLRLRAELGARTHAFHIDVCIELGPRRFEIGSKVILHERAGVDIVTKAKHSLDQHRSADQLASQFVTHQRPDLRDGVLARDLAANLGVEVFRARAGRLAGDGETVAQH